MMSQVRGWIFAAAAALASAGAAEAANVNSLYDPALPGGYNAAAFNPVADVTFDYQNGTLTDGVTVWTGTLEAAGSTVGNIQMWVFRFDSVNVASGISIDPYDGTGATQKPGLVLASRGDMTFDGTANFQGGNGSSLPGGAISGPGGPGGPGAEGGARGGSLASGPPNATAGDGGRGDGSDASPPLHGSGLGGGSKGTTKYSGGGGGGYATAGGDEQNNSNQTEPGTGGSAYGDALLADLFGGSGGGGGKDSVHLSSGGGGGGGGALELVAAGTLDFDGAINIYGGDGGEGTGGNTTPGGGGSGGGVLLVADTLIVSGAIDASGGDGKSKQIRASGGGSGGRVALYYGSSISGLVNFSEGAVDDQLTGDDSADNILLGGGFGPLNATDGGQGTLEVIQLVPEPATVGLLALGGLAMLGGAARRRRTR